jgi:hypothetical protein
MLCGSEAGHQGALLVTAGQKLQKTRNDMPQGAWISYTLLRRIRRGIRCQQTREHAP